MPGKTPRVVVLGAGGWGTAIANLLAGNGARVYLWGYGREKDYFRRVRKSRVNRKYLPGIRIPPEVELGWDASPLQEAHWMVMATPTQFCRKTLQSIAHHCPSRLPVVSVAKGLERGTAKRPSQIIRETLGRVRVAVLSGPSHAEEVARGLPATVVVAARQEQLARRAQKLFMNERLRVYTNSDPVGVELAAALKNVIALAAGICAGLGLGDNTRAALLSRGLVEMARFGAALGARRTTFFGLAGLGDLITTCFSPFGRNLSVGRQIGEGKTLPRILASMDKVAEGVETTRAVLELARRKKIEMPITQEVHRVLFEGKSPLQAIPDLMRRHPKSEVRDLG